MKNDNLFNIDVLKEAYEMTNLYDHMNHYLTNNDKLLHVVSEVAEVKDVLRNKDYEYGTPYSPEYRESLGLEVADMFLTAISAANNVGITPKELNEHIAKKLVILKERIEART